MSAERPAGPFLKWAGGKTQLLGQFDALYPTNVERYHEPFVGAGAVFFAIQALRRPAEVFLSDTNAELITTWRCLAQDVEGVIERLERHSASHTSEHYYTVRGLDTETLPELDRAARLIYLNRTCFNGLYRVNASGRFNVPLGRYANPRILDAANLRAVSAALGGARVDAVHFAAILDRARSGDFVYLDPPYDPVSKTASFTSYTRGSFGEQDQHQLAEVFARLAKRGCRVMLSNSDTPLVRRLYAAFDVREVQARRRINSRADRRGPVTELVVLSYDPERA